MWSMVVFTVITLILIFVSRRSLRSPRSHGFYRFFAWEGIAALVLINVPLWFDHPLAWHQLISWFLLVLCIVPLVRGVKALRTRGRPDKEKRSEAGLFAFERTTQLITGGVYQTIRHPLYSSLFLLNWGVFLKSPSWPGLLLAGATSFFLVLTAKADEAECLQTFGADYQEYMQHTKMFIPYLL